MMNYFFAMPDEQLRFMREALEIDGIWGLVESFVPHSYCTASIDLINLSPTEKHYHFGHQSLSEGPKWELAGRGSPRLDSVRSQVVCFEPSRLIEGNCLLEGHLWICKQRAFEEVGLQFGPVRNWYRKLVRRLRKLMSSQYVVTQALANGRVVQHAEMRISDASASHRESGGHLKQFVEGTVFFDVQKRGAMGHKSPEPSE